MSENELKSCPFCGGEARDAGSSLPGQVNIWCKNQPTKCSNRSIYKSTKAWNTRHLPPEVEEVLEAAREFEKKNRDLQQSLCLYKDFHSAAIAVRDAIRAYDKSRRK